MIVSKRPIYSVACGGVFETFKFHFAAIICAQMTAKKHKGLPVKVFKGNELILTL